MVGALKQWLGIKRLEQENLRLARSLQSAHQKIVSLYAQIEAFSEKRLTAEVVKPKMEAKPRRLNWRGTVAAIDRENAKEEANG